MIGRRWIGWAACCAAALVIGVARPVWAQPEPSAEPAPAKAPQQGRPKA
ncbi:MAG: hypothetical protein JNJ48_05110, partial [Phycisphaerae bacterium]|nr:hypothetical protein [Phycisphaerae bacterium]